MEAAAAELERLQIEILRRISHLETSILPQNSSAPLLSRPVDESETVTRLSAVLRSGGVSDFSFKRVAPDYYDCTLESRRDVLGASSVDHLCKSIVLVNTQASSNILDCSDRNNSKYYVVVVQYTARFNADAVKNFLYSLNEGNIPKKRFNLRLAPEETSIKLTGFEHNAVTCIGMKTDLPRVFPFTHMCLPSVFQTEHTVLLSCPNCHKGPEGFNAQWVTQLVFVLLDSLKSVQEVILDEAITKLRPDFFWLGGGEIDLKLGVRTSEFLGFVKPFIVPCS